MSRDDPFQGASLARGANLEFAAELNRRIVLEIIRDHGAISRAELAQQMRLTAQAISNITADLIAQGLVVTRERVTGHRGPRPTLYSINRLGRFIIGLHLEPYNLVGVATDLHGDILSEYTASCRANVRPSPSILPSARSKSCLRQLPSREVLAQALVWHCRVLSAMER